MTLKAARIAWMALGLGLAPVWGSGAAPAPLSALTLRVSGTAHGPNVLLRDVVEEELPEALASMALKAAGRPGSQVKVARALVQLKLNNPKAPVSVQGPSQCDISVPVQHIPSAQLQKFAGDFLAAQVSGTAGASIEPRGQPQDLDTYDATTNFIIKPSGQDWRGNVVLRVQVMQPGAGGQDHEVASVPVSFVVHRREGRLYTTKVLRKGDVLDAGNLALRDEDSTFAQGQGFASLGDVAGKRARAYLPAGKALTADLVEFPPLIRRGDMVRVLVKSGGIVIETQGKALRDARLGESLPLEVEATKKTVQARCVDADVAVRDAF